jgi:ribosomal protein S18 acetylase RimI-like enzyme
VTVTFRSARPADAEAVLRFWDEADLGLRYYDDVGALEALIANDDGALLLAEDDGRIIGTLIAAWDGWRGNFYRLAVDRSYRRRGIAGELVRAGERRLRGLGARRLVAAVGIERESAVEFWLGAGYELDPTAPRYVKNLEGG